MRQILQNLANGKTALVEVPCPQAREGYALISTSKSLISVGTERMLVDFGKAGWIRKAQSQPEKVKMVLDKVRTDGLSPTYEAIRSKLDQPLPLGYCNVGVICDSGSTGFSTGTRVVSNGPHAEMVRVPKNLIAEIPDGVDDDSAAFTVLGAIAMQGVRLANPTVGETIAVTGLGLIGLLTVQILRANGCRVLGIDFDSAKCELAERFGADTVDLSKNQDPVSMSSISSRGRGLDAVIITASSEDNSIIKQAAQMCRKRGRIVLVGVVGLELNRADFYEKELTFQVSCSYGPGRYDADYEDDGNDYPIGFVRWTEQRNFEAVLDLMASGSIDVGPLITHRFVIDDAEKAYSKLEDRSSLGILLDYGGGIPAGQRDMVVRLRESIASGPDAGNVAFIGGGNYASRVLIPAFKAAGATLNTLITSGGVTAVHHGSKSGFYSASTDIAEALNESVDTVVIATQHNLHAMQVLECLRKEKHVFVEKPLALTHADINLIEELQEKVNAKVMVGYNRRFSPFTLKMKALLDAKASPKSLIMTMNAGDIPKDHWTQNPEIGGGRIIGEACHYIDLMRFLVGSPIASFHASKMGSQGSGAITEDKASITLTFADGSMGTIHYFANGGRSFPKERIEVFCDNAVLQLDNFRKLRGYGWKGFKQMTSWAQDKGNSACVKAFMDSVLEGGKNPIPQEEIFEVARITVDIAHVLRD